VSMSDPNLPITVTYSQARWRAEWAVPEVPVPESTLHDLGLDYLKALLLAWAEREGRDVMVARNLGIRWVQEEPRAGFDPDLCVIEPPPANRELSTLRLWEPDHVAPWLAIEIVSPGHPYKDYLDTPARCAACGVVELWVYDPMMAGPQSSGGPFALQIWRRQGETMTRTHASNARGYSPGLGAWLVPMVQPAAAARRGLSVVESPSPSPQYPNTRLKIATAEVGGTFWPTLDEQRLESERRQAGAERQRAAAERRRADALEQECDALKRQLETLRGKQS
jgi:Uma2 family endonuclease